MSVFCWTLWAYPTNFYTLSPDFWTLGFKPSIQALTPEAETLQPEAPTKELLYNPYEGLMAGVMYQVVPSTHYAKTWALQLDRLVFYKALISPLIM